MALHTVLGLALVCDLAHGARDFAALDLEEDVAGSAAGLLHAMARKEAFGNVPEVRAECPGSGFFVDWGSSGMKVYPVHSGTATEPDELVSESSKPFKLKGLSPASSEDEVLAALDSLLPLLPEDVQKAPEHASSAILATAGHRLKPDDAHKVWKVVREWSEKHPGLFSRCTDNDDDNCRTIPGATEAALALASVVHEGTGQDLSSSGSPFAFVDGGGASVQVGFRGSDEEMEACLDDLGKLDTHFDPQRVSIKDISGKRTLVISFLSIANMDNAKRPCEDGQSECDFEMGGLDQARALFSKFIVNRKHGNTNPCLSDKTPLKPHPLCQRLFRVDSCVVDKWGGGISALPPTTAEDVNTDSDASRNARLQLCQKDVAEFLSSDLLMSRFRTSNSCMSLAGHAKRWLMMSAFARKDQLGAEVEQWVPFSEVKEAAEKQEWVTMEQAEEGHEGVIISAVLLTTFLEKLGAAPDAEMRAFNGQWPKEAMRQRNLVPGWLKKEHCS